MRIREYTPADLDALRRMHAAQGFGYPLPNLESPLFISKLVLEDGTDGSAQGREEADRNSLPASEKLSMAVLVRLTAETYLLHDPRAGTPKSRWRNFLALHEAARCVAASRGLDDAQAFLPPRVARAFGRRLERLGWRRDPWACYTLRLP